MSGCLGAERVSEFAWTNSDRSAIAIAGRNALVWDSVTEPPADIRLPGDSRELTRAADFGANGRAISPSGRYWATVSTKYAHYDFAGGDVVVIDLQEKTLKWTGIGFSDGTMIRVGELGNIISGPEDIDPYLIYTIRYSEGVVIPLTQLQFAARIGLSPGQQCVQRVLDVGGTVQLAGRDQPMMRDDLNDARDLPDIAEVTGVSLAGSSFVTGDTLADLKELPALATLDLSSSRVKDVDLGVLLDLANLRMLNLAGTQVTNTVGAALPAGLQDLDLRGTAVSDSLLNDLRGLKSLRRLVLTDTQTTDEAVDSFRKAMPDSDVIR